ncbi:hypothetical protein [Phascolarctobacterium succinatutens]|uniref:hypothetical protein n=1 Tax=Phascolarctobacterium succinatutens TaxID=626940 RepID=UPI0040290011
MAKLEDEYINVIKITRQLLDSNREWIDRYINYIQKINDIREQLKKARQAFYVPKPFKLYMPISKAMNRVFNLRFCGQDVADLKINTYNEVLIHFNKKARNIKKARDIFALMSNEDKVYFENLEDKFYPWTGEEAKRFRSIVKGFPPEKLCGQPEHKLESYLLDNYLQKSSQGKEILNIQPITMLEGSGFFQMPTPLKASGAKNGINNIKYAKSYGGGIDILARVGRGIGTQLAILELKDENISSEPPEEAIKQAIVYATFVRELLRSEVGKTYWRFFGFTRKLPEKLVLKAIIVMPYKAGVNTDFGKTSLQIEDTNDFIELGYIYRKDDGQAPEVCF